MPLEAVVDMVGGESVFDNAGEAGRGVLFFEITLFLAFFFGAGWDAEAEDELEEEELDDLSEL